MGLPFPGAAAPFGSKKGAAQKGAATAKGAAAKPVQGSKTPAQKMSKRSTSGHQGAGAAPKPGSSKQTRKANPFAAFNAARKKAGK